MKGTVIGLKHEAGNNNWRKGKVTVKEYNNLVLYIILDESPKDGFGKEAKILKVQWDKINEVFGKEIETLEDLKHLINTQIVFYYNDEKTIERIIES